MNVHHLELFYYVARYEGITRAVRRMPYGIQQPAVSGQILELEKELGVKLFQRRPFKLTPAGRELYDFATPFFSQLDEVSSRLREEGAAHLRLAAAPGLLPQSPVCCLSCVPDALDLNKRQLTGLKSAGQCADADCIGAGASLRATLLVPALAAVMVLAAAF